MGKYGFSWKICLKSVLQRVKWNVWFPLCNCATSLVRTQFFVRWDDLRLKAKKLERWNSLISHPYPLGVGQPELSDGVQHHQARRSVLRRAARPQLRRDARASVRDHGEDGTFARHTYVSLNPMQIVKLVAVTARARILSSFQVQWQHCRNSFGSRGICKMHWMHSIVALLRQIEQKQIEKST